MLKILTVPHPILRQKAKRVEKINRRIQQLIEAMIETLENNPRGGIGLAAPQVGQSLKIILAKDGREEKSKTYVLLNPEIVKRSKEVELGFEGCLSLPDTYGQVERHLKVVVRALNPKGRTVTIRAASLLARVLQHEIDHLNGVLITDKIIGQTLTEREYRQKEAAVA